ARGRFGELVGVQERGVKPGGECSAHGGLPRPHEPDQKHQRGWGHGGSQYTRLPAWLGCKRLPTALFLDVRRTGPLDLIHFERPTSRISSEGTLRGQNPRKGRGHTPDFGAVSITLRA